MALLEVHGLRKAFGGLQAVNGCTFNVEQGSITALIGPNGAGKTTVLNLISGILKPDKGRIVFDGHHIQRRPPHQITHRGMNRTFQISLNLEDMTVLENMAVLSPVGGMRGLFRPDISKAERERALELLAFVGIAHLAHEVTRNLSYGQKKLLDFASLLMADPKLILLDEPAGGVNPALLEKIIDRVRQLNDQGITFLIVEHNMEMVMSTCNQVVVMAYGTVIAEGTPQSIQNNQTVLEAYLGKVAS
ncbi:MAG: ABC transporter ATP-binding protein [Chloroflexi bacterium]|nr:ABC transporter ATP-binding protein [Chloroflexota bacterium]